MPLKSWILQRMNRINAVAGRPDLVRRASRGSISAEQREPSLRGVADSHDPTGPEHLGAYAPLIGAIRDELEHFVSSQLRLHLAIAERDRYLLTSIDVECVDGGDGADLLRRFDHEFTPEQIKRFLARDVIAQLPNASAIDLSQFAGLNAAQAQDNARPDDDAYAELLTELRSTTRSDVSRSFAVSLVGRWTDTEAIVPARATTASPRTPLAGSRLDVEIDDANGKRRVALAAVVANRRYSIGKGEGCDITVQGTFVSRRHCEIWLENGRWWAADAGSTNGVRVETASSVLGRAGPQAGGTQANAAIEIVPGARIVLSASMQGNSGEYPRVQLEHGDLKPSAATPLHPAAQSPKTPVTPLAAPRPRQAGLTLTVSMASGIQRLSLGEKALPIHVGRSHNQDLVVDWAHEGVSGHHIDITKLDEGGAQIEVHGDNGVTVDGVDHPQGQRFRWKIGERMTLGRASGAEPECTLSLGVRP
ncbi:MAG TPA: FHA domain-containing protein [Casimicrobiaceae bacterium]|nr:FHA domain-containing protein [Casimicrobiaceae bacterium]